MGLVTGTFSVITNDRVDYHCPGCGKEVWAYRGFQGTRCWDCPGTILGGIVRGGTGNIPILKDIGDSITQTTSDLVTNTKRYYYCEGCGKEKWAYGSFKGTRCFECSGPLAILDGTRKVVVNSTIKPITVDLFFKKGPRPRHLSPRGLNKDTEIYRIKVKSVWICHGLIGGVSSVFTGPLTNKAVTHWWVEIETYDDDEWYCAQFDGNNELRLSRHKSEDGVTTCGTRAGGNKHQNCDITTKHTDNLHDRNKTRKISHVIDFMKKYDSAYDILDNNCQHFARALWRFI